MKTKRFSLLLFSLIVLCFSSFAQNKDAEIKRLVRENTDKSIKAAAELFFDNDSIIGCMTDLGNPLYDLNFYRLYDFFTKKQTLKEVQENFPECKSLLKTFADPANADAAAKAEWEAVVRRMLKKVSVKNQAVNLNIIQQAFCNHFMDLPGDDAYGQCLNEAEIYSADHGYIGARNYKRINGCLGDYSGGGKNACNKKVITSIKDIKGTNYGNVGRVLDDKVIGEEPLSMNPSSFATILIMDAACNNSSLPIPVNLVRAVGIAGACPYLGLSGSTVEELKAAIDKELKSGPFVCKTQSYLSMSADALANYFIGFPDRQVMMYVKVPAETSMYVSYHLVESEIVFPRLAKGKVISTGIMKVPGKGEAAGKEVTMLTLDVEML